MRLDPSAVSRAAAAAGKTPVVPSAERLLRAAHSAEVQYAFKALPHPPTLVVQADSARDVSVAFFHQAAQQLAELTGREPRVVYAFGSKVTSRRDGLGKATTLASLGKTLPAESPVFILGDGRGLKPAQLAAMPQKHVVLFSPLPMRELTALKETLEAKSHVMVAPWGDQPLTSVAERLARGSAATLDGVKLVIPHNRNLPSQTLLDAALASPTPIPEWPRLQAQLQLWLGEHARETLGRMLGEPKPTSDSLIKSTLATHDRLVKSEEINKKNWVAGPVKPMSDAKLRESEQWIVNTQYSRLMQLSWVREGRFPSWLDARTLTAS